MKITQNKILFIFVFGVAHFVAGVAAFSKSFSMSMARFDTGAAPSLTERAIDFAAAILTFPFFHLADLLDKLNLALNRVLNPLLRVMFIGPGAWVLMFFNSLTWAVCFYNYVLVAILLFLLASTLIIWDLATQRAAQGRLR